VTTIAIVIKASFKTLISDDIQIAPSPEYPYLHKNQITYVSAYGKRDLMEQNKNV